MARRASSNMSPVDGNGQVSVLSSFEEKEELGEPTPGPSLEEKEEPTGEDLDTVLASIRAPRFLDFNQMLRDNGEEWNFAASGTEFGDNSGFESLQVHQRPFHLCIVLN